MTGRAPLLLAASVLLVLLALAPATTLWDRDEPRNAGAAVEMAASGDLLVPTFNGELRARKPVLVTWLMASAVALLGPTELAVRLFSAAGIAVAVWLTVRTGARLLTPRAGLLAGAFLASSPLVVVQGLAATTDAVLLAFVTLAIALFAEGLTARTSAARTALLGAALGGALLTKGPVGLAVPLLVAGGTLAFHRDLPGGRRAKALSLLAASLGGLALLALWFVPANAATGGRYLAIGLGREVLHRMAAPMEGHGGGFLVWLPYYLPVLLAGCLPWSLLLPAAVPFAVRLKGERPAAATLLLAWVAAPLALFSLVATKLPHYVLPCFPALSLLAGGVADLALGSRLGPAEERWLCRGAILGSLGTVALAAGIGWAFLNTPVDGSRAPLAALLAILAATGPPAVLLLATRRHRAGIAVLFAGTVGMELVAAGWLGPTLEALKPVPRIAAAIRRATGPEVPVAALGFGEPSLVFYVGRPPVRFLAGAEEAAGWARARSPGVLVASREALDALRASHPGLGLVPLAREAGYNVAKGEPVELVALLRQP